MAATSYSNMGLLFVINCISMSVILEMVIVYNQSSNLFNSCINSISNVLPYFLKTLEIFFCSGLKRCGGIVACISSRSLGYNMLLRHHCQDRIPLIGVKGFLNFHVLQSISHCCSSLHSFYYTRPVIWVEL